MLQPAVELRGPLPQPLCCRHWPHGSWRCPLWASMCVCFVKGSLEDHEGSMRAPPLALLHERLGDACDVLRFFPEKRIEAGENEKETGDRVVGLDRGDGQKSGGFQSKEIRKKLTKQATQRRFHRTPSVVRGRRDDACFQAPCRAWSASVWPRECAMLTSCSEAKTRNEG